MSIAENIIFWAREIAGPPSYNHCGEAQALDLIEYAYKRGIRVFDTAPIYGNGRSEELLGKALWSVRSDVEIITKFWIRREEGKRDKFCFTKKSIKQELEISLDKLHTDYIDTYLLHMPWEWLDVDEVVETLEELKEKWYIKQYGVSNCYEQLLQEFIKKWNIEYVQDFYNLMYLDTEKLVFPYLTERQKFINYGPLYRWLLTQKTITELLKSDQAAINRLLKTPELKEKLKRVELLRKVAQSKWMALEEYAYTWLFQKWRVNSVLVWTTKKEHLDFAIDTYKKIKSSI